MPCIAFDGLASSMSEYLSVGDRVMLLGKLIPDKFSDTPYRFKFQVSSYEFVESIEEHKQHALKHPIKKYPKGGKKS